MHLGACKRASAALPCVVPYLKCLVSGITFWCQTSKMVSFGLCCSDTDHDCNAILADAQRPTALMCCCQSWGLRDAVFAGQL